MRRKITTRAQKVAIAKDNTEVERRINRSRKKHAREVRRAYWRKKKGRRRRMTATERERRVVDIDQVLANLRVEDVLEFLECRYRTYRRLAEDREAKPSWQERVEYGAWSALGELFANRQETAAPPIADDLAVLVEAQGVAVGEDEITAATDLAWEWWERIDGPAVVALMVGEPYTLTLEGSGGARWCLLGVLPLVYRLRSDPAHKRRLALFRASGPRGRLGTDLEAMLALQGARLLLGDPEFAALVLVAPGGVHDEHTGGPVHAEDLARALQVVAGARDMLSDAWESDAFTWLPNRLSHLCGQGRCRYAPWCESRFGPL